MESISTPGSALMPVHAKLTDRAGPSWVTGSRPPMRLHDHDGSHYLTYPAPEHFLPEVGPEALEQALRERRAEATRLAAEGQADMQRQRRLGPALPQGLLQGLGANLGEEVLGGRVGQVV